jgi:hypothetical protein
MLHFLSLQRHVLLIGLGAVALLSVPASPQSGSSASDQSGLSQMRKNFISFTPGVAGVSLGAWIAPTGNAKGRLHGGFMDGQGNYLLEIDGVLVENYYLVESPRSGSAYGVVFATAGFMRAPVAYFLGLWVEPTPGVGEFMATLYEPLNQVGGGNLLAGVMAGSFSLDGPGDDFVGIDGVDGIGLDEVDDLPHEIGIQDNKWAGGPPIDVSSLMYTSLIKLRDDFDAAGVGELNDDVWAGGPPVKVLFDLQAAKIEKLVNVQSAGFYKDGISHEGNLDDVGSHKKIGQKVSDGGDKDGISVGQKEEPRVGTFRLRWKLFD